MNIMPSALQEKGAAVVAKWSQLAESASLQTDAFFQQTAASVWGYSDYVAQMSLQQPQLLIDLFVSQNIHKIANRGDYLKMIQAILAQNPTIETLMSQLRQLRHRELMRLIWQRVTNLQSARSLARVLNEFAEVILSEVINYLSSLHHDLYGIALNEENKPSILYVLALGKLGGQDLNFSSDIDIIFTYFTPHHWQNTRKEWDANQYFCKLAQQVVKVISEVTQEGFVFRVDLRLRPFGQSGPIVMSYTAMEQYYQQHGREWERYALIKARILNGSSKAEKKLLETLLHCFSYRRYVDYSVIDALRKLKALIDKQVHEESAEEDIKRGRGGLREVEFIIQTFQLLKGGKDRRLQTPDLYQAVKMIAAEEWLPRAQVMQLQQDYDVLRTVEDSIQMIADRQTQLYPNNDLDQARLAWVMGYANWQEFVTKLAPMRKRINQQFSQLFYTPKTTSTQPELNEMFSKLWHAQVSIVTWAIQAGKETSQVWERCDTVLQTFRDSHQITRLSKEAQIRLDQLMPLVLAIIVEQKDPDVYLQRFLQVISAIVRRSTYLSLLIENSDALLHLIQCCGQSIWLSDQLSQYPILLDSLLDQRLSLLSLDKDALENRLEQALLATPEEDTEAQLEILRQHKNEYTLQATKAYLTAQLDDDALGLCLSQCAEAFLNVIARLAWRWVAVKYNLQEGDDINIPPWAIVAYGKLGGKEMGFQSDLDIVFLYDNGAALELEVTLQQQRAEYSYQWARRVVYWLELKTYNGYLYKVDTQLRPSGQAGLLVSDIVHFKTYQLEQAWLWEHQALLRARVVASCGQMATQFAHIRHQVLAQNRPIDKLQQEIVAMRQRMQMHQATIPKEKFDIKQGQGGLIDVEFMIQFLSLSTLRQETERLSYTSHREWLQWVSNLGTIDNKTGAVLLAIYHYYRQQLNQAALQNAPSWVDEESMQEKRAIAQQIWQMLFARGDHDE